MLIRLPPLGTTALRAPCDATERSGSGTDGLRASVGLWAPRRGLGGESGQLLGYVRAGGSNRISMASAMRGCEVLAGAG